MRTIQFRGKRKDNNEWVYGSVIQCAGIWYIYNENESFRMPQDPDFETSFIEVVPETIGQFTGLYDKHGKEVFEGDVVKDDHGRIMKIGEWRYKPCFIAVSKTNFHHADFFEWLNRDTNVLECEVIGNIHENPELLEQ